MPNCKPCRNRLSGRIACKSPQRRRRDIVNRADLVQLEYLPPLHPDQSDEDQVKTHACVSLSEERSTFSHFGWKVNADRRTPTMSANWNQGLVTTPTKIDLRKHRKQHSPNVSRVFATPRREVTEDSTRMSSIERLVEQLQNIASLNTWRQRRRQRLKVNAQDRQIQRQLAYALFSLMFAGCAVFKPKWPTTQASSTAG